MTTDLADDLQLRLNQLSEGLGSAYERYALNRFLLDLVKRYEIRSVLEVPANGVMGVPGIKSMALSAAGVSVTLVNPSKEILSDARKLWGAQGLKASFVVGDVDAVPVKDDSFDLVWNFCCFEHFSHPDTVVSEMRRCTRKHVLIEVQNIFNIGLWIHPLYHKIHGEPWDHGQRKSMDWRKVKQTYSACGLNVIEVDGNDMPPWPDINMRAAEALNKKTNDAKPKCDFRPNVKTKSAEEVLSLWSKPPAEKNNSPRMMFLRLWHDVIERTTPKFIRIFLCHHPYVVGVKR